MNIISPSPRPTVFLDRDGVLNKRIVDGYVTHPDELEVLPGVYEALYQIAQKGYRMAVVTNQQGIGKQLMTTADLEKVHEKLKKELDGLLTEFYVCPHLKDLGCVCRKPKPGLLDAAHAQEPVEWKASFLIGDSDTDILAGNARDVFTIKVAGPSNVAPNAEVRDLPAAVDLILQTASQPS